MAERQWRLLAEIGEELAPSRDLGPAIDRVALRVVPSMADCFVLFLAGPRHKPPDARRWHLHGERSLALREGLQEIFKVHGPKALRSVAWRDALHDVFASVGLTSGVAGVAARTR